MQELFDISMSIHPGMPVFPGDSPPQQKWLRRMQDGACHNLSALALGSHTGTHVDAPYHFVEKGITLDEIPLEVFVGKALVIEITDPVSISADELRGHTIASAERVLFKTRNSSTLSRGEFQEDFVYIEGEAAEYLVSLGVRLVGVDYLSVDRYGDESSPAHHALLGCGVVILEGADLSEVEAGVYTLVCLPLKVGGAEGSPVRAVLMR